MLSVMAIIQWEIQYGLYKLSRVIGTSSRAKILSFVNDIQIYRDLVVRYISFPSRYLQHEPRLKD